MRDVRGREAVERLIRPGTAGLSARLPAQSDVTRPPGSPDPDGVSWWWRDRKVFIRSLHEQTGLDTGHRHRDRTRRWARWFFQLRHSARRSGEGDRRRRQSRTWAHRRTGQQRRRPVHGTARIHLVQGLGRGGGQQPQRRLSDGTRVLPAKHARARRQHRQHRGRYVRFDAQHGPQRRRPRGHVQLHRNGGGRVGSQRRGGECRGPRLHRIQRHGPLPARGRRHAARHAQDRADGALRRRGH